MPYETDYTDAVELEYEPNEKCKECGLEVENYHFSCQGHQNCLPECPSCGGELVDIGSR